MQGPLLQLMLRTKYTLGVASSFPPRSASDPIAPSLRRQFVSALESLEVALTESTAANQAALERARDIRQLIERGISVTEIVLNEEPPLIVELTSDNVQRLYDAGGRLRRIEARMLHAEGLTMDKIARLFGVSRQRVSALIGDKRP